MTQSGAGPEASALRALEFVDDGQTLGLGTGRAAAAFVRALGARVGEGLDVRGVPTSDATEALAREVGIPLLELAQAGTLDATFDGADEVSPDLDVVKGYGGALVREKIVAASSRRLVILVGEEKLVEQLGARGRLPVEVVPFGVPLARRILGEMGLPPEVRCDHRGSPIVTDNGNHILDCKVGPIDDPAALDLRIQALPGVVGTGIFAGMADAVVVQRADRVDVLERPEPRS
ncbi:MAG: ribose-5-phosphate isomerase RpiA [Myxococcota bacterium]